MRESRSYAVGGGRRAGALLLLFLLGLASVATGAPRLELERGEFEGKRLEFRFALSGFLDEELQASLESGLPATLLLRWTVFEHREAWWDRDLVAGHLNFRIYYDLLESSYELFDGRGRSVARCADLAELESVLEERRPLIISLPARLAADRRYRIHLEARLEPLPEGEIRDLELWLRGEDKGKGGMLGGIDRDAGKLLRRLQGMGDRRAVAELDWRPGSADPR